MNKYRTHYCNSLRKENVGQKTVLSGWINKKRDHGNLLFLDLRDNCRTLITPLPGYSTHGETQWLSPFTDWSKV